MAKVTRLPAVPPGLSKAAEGWFRELQREFNITDPGGLLLLEQVCRHFDRAEQARKLLDADGPVTLDAKGRPKTHPAFQVERDARSGLRQALAALNLDLEPLRDRVGRPGAGE